MIVLESRQNVSNIIFAVGKGEDGQIRYQLVDISDEEEPSRLKFFNSGSRWVIEIAELS